MEEWVLNRTESEWKHHSVSDVAGIIGGYERRFAFKLADGFSEKETAAKLGDPSVLAAQSPLQCVPIKPAVFS